MAAANAAGVTAGAGAGATVLGLVAII